MMKDTLQDIIDIMNSEFSYGTFILHKEIKVHPKFKVYKTFHYELYLKTKDDLIPILDQEETINTSCIDDAWNDTSNKFARMIVKWMLDGSLMNLVKKLNRWN